MRSPFLNWTCGLAAIMGLPIGLIVAIAEGSLLAGLGSMITVVLIGLLVCRKEITQEYKDKEKRTVSTRE